MVLADARNATCEAEDVVGAARASRRLKRDARTTKRAVRVRRTVD